MQLEAKGPDAHAVDATLLQVARRASGQDDPQRCDSEVDHTIKAYLPHFGCGVHVAADEARTLIRQAELSAAKPTAAGILSLWLRVTIGWWWPRMRIRVGRGATGRRHAASSRYPSVGAIFGARRQPVGAGVQVCCVEPPALDEPTKLALTAAMRNFVVLMNHILTPSFILQN